MDSPNQSSPSKTAGQTGVGQHDSQFFDSSNAAAAKQRENLAMECLEDAITWLNQGGKLAILDATNTTVERRAAIKERVFKERKIKCFFIESICLDNDILEANIQLKLQGPDYNGMDSTIALEDFRQRIKNYEKVYATISVEEEKRGYSYIKIIDVGSKIVANRIKGCLPSQCVFYLMQMHIAKRTIWLSANGESANNQGGIIGGNTSLTLQGKAYSQALFQLIDDNTEDFSSSPDSPSPAFNSCTRKPKVFCSTLASSIETVQPFTDAGYDVGSVKFLNEIYSGEFEGLTVDQVKAAYPIEYANRIKNKITFRYPGVGGESILVIRAK